MSQNGLIVYYQRADQKRVDRELKSVDPRLFLDPEFSQQYGQVFWTVKVWNGEQAPDPVTIVVDWREPDGRPKELTHGIVEQTRRSWKAGPVSFEAVMAANDELRRKRDERQLELYERQTIQTQKELRRKPVFHRGRGLWLARIRGRRKGDNV